MNKKTIVILSNISRNIFLFKMVLLRKLSEHNYKVIVVASDKGKTKEIEEIVDDYISYPIDAIGLNPIHEYKTYRNLKKILLDINPDIVLSYTIKPNVYSNLILKNHKSKVLNMICGRGRIFDGTKPLRRLIVGSIFKHALKNSDCVYINNHDDLDYMIDNKYLKSEKCKFLRGEGTDIIKFTSKKEKTFDTIDFLFIGRLIKSKGMEDYLNSLLELKKEYSHIRIHVAGPAPKGDPDAIDINIVNDLSAKGEIIYHGWIQNQIPVFEESNCVVLPTSYNEGMPVSLMEAASMGLPIVCSDISACKQVVKNGYNGFLCKKKDYNDLKLQLKKFIELSDKEKIQMGINARIKAEKEFDSRLIAEEVIADFESLL